MLDDGHVAGMGTHEELLASCPVYQEIYRSQFKQEATGTVSSGEVNAHA